MAKSIQAITGVSASSEIEIRSKYPSVAATGIGRFLGQILETIPIKIWGVKISYLLFGLALLPVALAIYVMQKLTGERYTITNRSIQRWTIFNPRMVSSIALNDIADVVVQQQSGQSFFRSADIYLLNAKGDPMMVLDGVPHADVFRQTILKARDAKMSVEQSLKTIRARKA